MWLPAARRAGDLGTILRGYRRASALTQQQLAEMLGYDRTYISMIESGRRHVTGRGTLAHIARTLAIPPHLLGIAGPDDADFAAMLAFGTSVIRLAAIARRSGRAAEAVSELWPLVTRLEARVAAGYAEPEAMSLLARARMSLGVALGHLLPDEHAVRAAVRHRADPVPDLTRREGLRAGRACGPRGLGPRPGHGSGRTGNGIRLRSVTGAPKVARPSATRWPRGRESGGRGRLRYVAVEQVAAPTVTLTVSPAAASR